MSSVVRHVILSVSWVHLNYRYDACRVKLKVDGTLEANVRLEAPAVLFNVVLVFTDADKLEILGPGLVATIFALRVFRLTIVSQVRLSPSSR
jgi:hypothetical protein